MAVGKRGWKIEDGRWRRSHGSTESRPTSNPRSSILYPRPTSLCVAEQEAEISVGVLRGLAHAVAFHATGAGTGRERLVARARIWNGTVGRRLGSLRIGLDDCVRHIRRLGEPAQIAGPLGRYE